MRSSESDRKEAGFGIGIVCLDPSFYTEIAVPRVGGTVGDMTLGTVRRYSGRLGVVP